MKENAAPPLVVTADAALLDELSRLAAAAGVVPQVVADVGSALRAWSQAPLVLVGDDLAGTVAASSPPRRHGVHLVTLGSAEPLYPAALACAAESVRCLPAATESLVGDLTDSGDGGRSAGVVVGVIGGAGGVGATVFATALAQVLAESQDVLLLDTDWFGAGIDRVLGIEATEGVRWDGMVQAAGRLSARSLHDALPRRDRLSVLTWPVARTAPVPPVAMRGALSAGRRGYPVVVVDLARHLDPSTEEVVLRCDQIVLLSSLTLPAVSTAARLASRLPSTTGLVLRGADGGVAAGEVGTLLGLRVLTRMRDQRGLDEAIGLGLGPLRSRRGALAKAARTVAAGVFR